MILYSLIACGSQSILVQGGEDTSGDLEPRLGFDSGLEQAPGDTAPDTGEPPKQEQPDLFQADTTWDFALEIGDAAWQDLERDGRNFVPAQLSWQDVQISVQVHIKGSSSWQSINDKPSLVVDVNRDDPDQEFMGIKKFNLQNDCYDPSMMSSTLSYGFYREWGYPASRTSFANLTVNGRDYGLYVVLEAHNDDFLEQWFADANGNLYENAEAYCDVTDLGCMEVEEYDEGNDAAFFRLAQAARTGREGWLAAAQGVLAYDQFVQYLALEMSVVHWDSYSYDLSNYSMYHDPSSDRFTMLTQSMDLDYGFRPWSYPNCGQYGMDLDKYTMGMLAESCHDNATCRADVVAAVSLIADQMELADGAARVLALDERIGEDVRRDPRRYYSDAEYQQHVACLQSFFAGRPQALRDWVARQ